MEGEGDKPDLKIVHSSGTDEPKADKTTEDTASIIRKLTQEFSKLSLDQARVMWASKLTDSLDEAIEKSGLSPDEYHRLFKEANATLYPKQPSDFNIGTIQQDHPSGNRQPEKNPEVQGDNIIPFPKPSEKQE